MLITKENIVSVIPQRPPIVMVDELLECNETVTRCSFEVRADNIFLRDGLLLESGLVENIAQTAAAGTGYTAQQAGEPTPVGFIGTVQQLEIFELPKVGSQLITEISITNKIFDITVIKGTVQHNGTLLAQCEMKIFIQKQA